jgi:hypothetical protein
MALSKDEEKEMYTTTLKTANVLQWIRSQIVTVRNRRRDRLRT